VPTDQVEKIVDGGLGENQSAFLFLAFIPCFGGLSLVRRHDEVGRVFFSKQHY
jgi:hypothetical protein